MERGRFYFAAFTSGLAWMFLSGLMVLGSGYYNRNTVALITNGIETTAQITSYTPHKCGSRKRRHICHDHTLLAEELGAVTLDLHSQYDVGERIAVTYETGNKANLHVGHKPTLRTLDGLQYAAFAILALSSTMFVIGWHEAVSGLGLRRKILRVMAYPLLLTLVLGVYVWGIAAFFGINSFQVIQAAGSSLQAAFWPVPSHSPPRLSLMLPVPCNNARSPAEAVKIDESETCYYDLATFRRLYPEYNDLSEEVLSDHLSRNSE